MRTVFVIFVFAVLSFAQSTLAQTTNGEIPAQETVCDPLKADGVTKGLYGLCVAFCEAQNHASADIPVTEAALELLEADAPSGRILANYDNKRNPVTDPPMPCIVEESLCPCWSALELSSIGAGGNANCEIHIDLATQVIDVRSVFTGAIQLGDRHEAMAADLHNFSGSAEYCEYIDIRQTPNQLRLLSVEAGTLTHDQAAACLDQVNTRCAELGL